MKGKPRPSNSSTNEVEDIMLKRHHPMPQNSDGGALASWFARMAFCPSTLLARRLHPCYMCLILIKRAKPFGGHLLHDVMRRQPCGEHFER
jgi:hypothetical protein